jgi:GAF domain-containing protein
LGISEDITEQKQAEAERERLLAEVEATYRQYVQQEWGQFLGEQHHGRWRIEHAALATEPGDNGNHKAAIEAPIALRGQQIGSLRLEDLDPTRRWTAEEKALVEAVSQQLAQTVENLRLFDETQQRAGREHLTRQITDKMRAASDVDSIIETGLSELAKALGVSRTYVKLSPKADSSKIEAVRDELKHNGFKAISATASASQREEAENSDQVEEK